MVSPYTTQRNADTGSPSTSATAIRSIPAGAMVVQAASKNEAGGGGEAATSSGGGQQRIEDRQVSRASLADDRAPSLRQPHVAPGAFSHRGPQRRLALAQVQYIRRGVVWRHDLGRGPVPVPEQMGRHDLRAPPGGLHDEVNHVAGGREPLQALGGGRGQRPDRRMRGWGRGRRSQPPRRAGSLCRVTGLRR